MLKEILHSKRAQIEKLAKTRSIASFEGEAGSFKHRNFSEKLTRSEQSNQIGVIAEVKKASPSKGILRENFEAKNIARLYENNSAACISVLTDEKFFKGSIENLILARQEVSIPVLRKDFIIDPLQVAESYAKVMTADFVMSLSRKIEDKIGDTGRFHVIKNRFGPDGLTYPARVNTNIGKIELFEAKSAQGKEVQSKIRNRDNQTKQMLSARYDDLMNDD